MNQLVHLNGREEKPVAHMSNRMTEADYERERTALRETYGDKAGEPNGKRDQALAKLFYQSGWTQEELAKKEGKEQPYNSQKLQFGRFLDFIASGNNSEKLPHNLTERRFRSYWEQTEKANGNENIRFRAVLRLMEEDTALMRSKRKQVGEDIKAQFADGKWHKLETIVKAINPDDENHVAETLRKMRVDGTYGVKAEHKQVGTSWSYRIFPKEKMVSAAELAEKLAPIIEGLRAEGKKNMATMSPPTVAMLVTRLERLIQDWEK